MKKILTLLFVLSLSANASVVGGSAAGLPTGGSNGQFLSLCGSTPCWATLSSTGSWSFSGGIASTPGAVDMTLSPGGKVIVLGNFDGHTIGGQFASLTTNTFSDNASHLMFNVNTDGLGMWRNIYNDSGSNAIGFLNGTKTAYPMGQSAFDSITIGAPRGGTASTAPVGVAHITPTTTPGSPTEGDCYWDSTLHKLRCYDGTIWNNAW